MPERAQENFREKEAQSHVVYQKAKWQRLEMRKGNFIRSMLREIESRLVVRLACDCICFKFSVVLSCAYSSCVASFCSTLCCLVPS